MRKTAAALLSEIEETMGESWLPRIYRERILKTRTRAYQFPRLRKTAEPEIQHTLLGIELKVGRRRMLVPDLSTARYLRLFARIRCRAVAIPYDITRISHLADELESSWQRMLLIAESVAASRSTAFRARLRHALIGKVQNELDEAGAGPRVPGFKQSTKQREPQKGTKSPRRNTR